MVSDEPTVIWKAKSISCKKISIEKNPKTEQKTNKNKTKNKLN